MRGTPQAVHLLAPASGTTTAMDLMSIVPSLQIACAKGGLSQIRAFDVCCLSGTDLVPNCWRMP